MKGLLVVGSVNMDLTLEIDRAPRPGETLLARRLRRGPGGKGANQAVAASRLGVPTAFCGMTGDDAYGEELRRALADEGVDVSLLRTVPGTASGLAVIQTAGGESTILVAPGANACLTAQVLDDLEPAVFRRDFLAVQLEIPHEAALRAMARAREAGAAVLLDPSPAEGVGAEIIKAADVVLPNREEASLITGIEVRDQESATRAGRALRRMGARSAVVKLGEEGAVFISDEGALRIPPHPVRTVDATAAGDAFLAGLVVGMSRGLPLPEALPLAARVGALAASKRGAMSSLPRDEDLDALTP